MALKQARGESAVTLQGFVLPVGRECDSGVEAGSWSDGKINPVEWEDQKCSGCEDDPGGHHFPQLRKAAASAQEGKPRIFAPPSVICVCARTN